MKHRHRLAQRQRQRSASPSRRAEVYEETDEQPSSSAGKPKKRTAHQMRAEGGKTKPRLDKFRRGGRPRNRYDNGGPAGSTAGSTRSADDPGGELAAATRERKGTLGRLQDELLGPKSAYKRGGRLRHRGYDDGGVIDDSDVAPSTGGSSLGSNPRNLRLKSRWCVVYTGESAGQRAAPGPSPVVSSTASQQPLCHQSAVRATGEASGSR